MEKTDAQRALEMMRELGLPPETTWNDMQRWEELHRQHLAATEREMALFQEMLALVQPHSGGEDDLPWPILERLAREGNEDAARLLREIPEAMKERVRLESVFA